MMKSEFTLAGFNSETKIQYYLCVGWDEHNYAWREIDSVDKFVCYYVQNSCPPTPQENDNLIFRKTFIEKNRCWRVLQSMFPI